MTGTHRGHRAEGRPATGPQVPVRAVMGVPAARPQDARSRVRVPSDTGPWHVRIAGAGRGARGADREGARFPIARLRCTQAIKIRTMAGAACG